MLAGIIDVGLRVAIFAIGAVALAIWYGVRALFGSRSRPGTCDICGNAIDRKSHRISFDGLLRTVCPHCYMRAKRERSRIAWRQHRLGES